MYKLVNKQQSQQTSHPSPYSKTGNENSSARLQASEMMGYCQVTTKGREWPPSSMDPYRTTGRTMNILIGTDSQISHRTGVTVLMHNFNTYLDSGRVQIRKNTKSPFHGFLLQPHFEAALLYNNITAKSVIFHITFYIDHNYLFEVNLRPRYNYQMRNTVIIFLF